MSQYTIPPSRGKNGKKLGGGAAQLHFITSEINHQKAPIISLTPFKHGNSVCSISLSNTNLPEL